MFFLSCLIVALSQPSFIPWLGPIGAAVGYALFWRSLPLNGRFWRGTVWYTLVSLIQLSWMTSIEYQGFYILLVWLALSVGVGIQFGLLTKFISPPLRLVQILGIASFWTILEWSRFFFLCGYSWNLSGLALSNPYCLQLASVFGVLGLSFWVIFSNLLGLKALAEKQASSIVAWVAAICLPYLFGFVHLSYHQTQMEKAEQKPFTCLLVQTGLLPSQKTLLDGRPLEYLSPYFQWGRILELLKDSKPADLIVLPESAVPFSAHHKVYNKSTVDQLFIHFFGSEVAEFLPPSEETKVSNAYWAQGLANIFQSDLILGLDHEEEGKFYSSAFYVNPRENSIERYDKRILVPLVEYLPFSFLTPLVKSYGITAFFEHGKEAKVFDGKLPMSVSICYEETFPQNVREGRLKGAKMLINVTNDGWYPFSLLPSQHYEHAKIRAVESGAPLLRACNTGVSAAVDSLGQEVAKLAESTKEKNLQAGVLMAQINPYEYRTLFTIWGNGGILCLCVIFFGLFLLSNKNFYRSK
ncbi:MAG: apolipoprotein N-acyltransferase [Verrucomicrobia bacterium]|nr:apolipoprotein N-acyltransferase [Verrucomicrobiota bacterium]